jgi:CRP-like cAMP-binding protein
MRVAVRDFAMTPTTTVQLHEQADAAAAREDFATALKFSAEALRLMPLDGRARLKVALCLAAFGQVDQAISALRIVAQTLVRRGYVLSAIGACRDALGVRPGAPEVRSMLEQIHDRIFGLEGRGRARVPPPSPPMPVPKDRSAGFLDLSEPRAIIEKSVDLATRDPDEAEIKSEVAAVPLFSDLSRTAFLSLVEKMNYLKLPAGHVVVREGDQGSSLYILVQGEVRVTRREGTEELAMARLGAGSLFGELALIRSKPRGATVSTIVPSELFEIGRDAIERVAASNPAITEDLVRFARRRLIMNLMATSKIFQPFDDAQRLEVLRAFVSRVVEAGTRIISEGTEPNGLYVLLEGEVEVSKVDESGDKVVLAHLREGEVFGEIALVEKRQTTATVTATEKSVVLYLDRAKFDAFQANHPKIQEYLASLSGARLSETERAMSAEGVILEADDLIIL